MDSNIIYVSTEIEVDLMDYIDKISTSDLLEEIENRETDNSDNKLMTLDLVSAHEVFNEALKIHGAIDVEDALRKIGKV